MSWLFACLRPQRAAADQRGNRRQLDESVQEKTGGVSRAPPLATPAPPITSASEYANAAVGEPLPQGARTAAAPAAPPKESAPDPPLIASAPAGGDNSHWCSVAEHELAKEAVLEVCTMDGGTLLWSSNQARVPAAEASPTHYLQSLLGQQHPLQDVLTVVSVTGGVWMGNIRVHASMVQGPGPSSQFGPGQAGQTSLLQDQVSDLSSPALFSQLSIPGMAPQPVHAPLTDIAEGDESRLLSSAHNVLGGTSAVSSCVLPISTVSGGTHLGSEAMHKDSHSSSSRRATVGTLDGERPGNGASRRPSKQPAPQLAATGQQVQGHGGSSGLADSQCDTQDSGLLPSTTPTRSSNANSHALRKSSSVPLGDPPSAATAAGATGSVCSRSGSIAGLPGLGSSVGPGTLGATGSVVGGASHSQELPVLSKVETVIRIGRSLRRSSTGTGPGGQAGPGAANMGSMDEVVTIDGRSSAGGGLSYLEPRTQGAAAFASRLANAFGEVQAASTSMGSEAITALGTSPPSATISRPPAKGAAAGGLPRLAAGAAPAASAPDALPTAGGTGPSSRGKQQQDPLLLMDILASGEGCEDLPRNQQPKWSKPLSMQGPTIVRSQADGEAEWGKGSARATPKRTASLQLTHLQMGPVAPGSGAGTGTGGGGGGGQAVRAGPGQVRAPRLVGLLQNFEKSGGGALAGPEGQMLRSEPFADTKGNKVSFELNLPAKPHTARGVRSLGTQHAFGPTSAGGTHELGMRSASGQGGLEAMADRIGATFQRARSSALGFSLGGEDGQEVIRPRASVGGGGGSMSLLHAPSQHQITLHSTGAVPALTPLASATGLQDSVGMLSALRERPRTSAMLAAAGLDRVLNSSYLHTTQQQVTTMSSDVHLQELHATLNSQSQSHSVRVGWLMESSASGARTSQRAGRSQGAPSGLARGPSGRGVHASTGSHATTMSLTGQSHARSGSCRGLLLQEVHVLQLDEDEDGDNGEEAAGEDGAAAPKGFLNTTSSWVEAQQLSAKADAATKKRKPVGRAASVPANLGLIAQTQPVVGPPSRGASLEYPLDPGDLGILGPVGPGPEGRASPRDGAAGSAAVLPTRAGTGLDGAGDASSRLLQPRVSQRASLQGQGQGPAGGEEHEEDTGMQQEGHEQDEHEDQDGEDDGFNAGGYQPQDLAASWSVVQGGPPAMASSQAGFPQQLLTPGAGVGPGAMVVLQASVRAITHPITQERALLVVLRDVTARSAVEDMLVEMTENQLGMISQMFPRHIIDFLASGAGSMGGGLAGVPANIGLMARRHTDVTLLFMDIVGFTTMSKDVQPWQVMSLLNELFSIFDELVSVHRVHKVETAGDCYIVSAGVVEEGPDGFLAAVEHHDPAESARRVMAFAKDMLRAAAQVRMPNNGLPVTIRVGIHTGNCTSGLIGTRLPKFSIFGDSMNTASRMESTCAHGRIQVSETTHALLHEEDWEPTGGVHVKGKGNMLTFLWIPPKDDPLFVTAGPLSASQASPGATTASGEVVSLELGTAPPAASVAPDAASATAVAAATPAVPGEEAASTAATAVAAAAACTVSAPAAAAAGEAAAATAAAGPSRLNSSSTAAGGATAPASPAVMLLRPQGSAGYRAVSGSQGSGPALLAHAASRATSGSGDFLLQGSLATQPVEPQPTLPLAHRFVLGSATRTMGGASCTSAENTGGSAANVAIWESALAASRAAGGGGAQQPAPSQHQSGAHAQHPSVHWAGSANIATLMQSMEHASMEQAMFSPFATMEINRSGMHAQHMSTIHTNIHSTAHNALTSGYNTGATSSAGNALGASGNAFPVSSSSGTGTASATPPSTYHGRQGTGQHAGFSLATLVQAANWSVAASVRRGGPGCSAAASAAAGGSAMPAELLNTLTRTMHEFPSQDAHVQSHSGIPAAAVAGAGAGIVSSTGHSMISSAAVDLASTPSLNYAQSLAQPGAATWEGGVGPQRTSARQVPASPLAYRRPTTSTGQLARLTLLTMSRSSNQKGSGSRLGAGAGGGPSGGPAPSGGAGSSGAAGAGPGPGSTLPLRPQPSQDQSIGSRNSSALEQLLLADGSTQQPGAGVRLGRPPSRDAQLQAPGGSAVGSQPTPSNQGLA